MHIDTPFVKKARRAACFLLLLTAFHARADIRLPSIFGSHMVLQQNTEIRFWGWAAPEDKLVILCSWLPGREFKAGADRSSLQWSVLLPTPEASYEPHYITIKGGWADIVLDDILFGEVWVCSGQSNMEWRPSWGNLDITEAQYEAANDSSLRLFTVPRMSVPESANDCRGAWSRSTREEMRQFSAVAYFFGRELRDRLGIPIGLINTSWGGTPIEAWMHEQDFETGAFATAITEHHPIWNYGRPGSLWNGMIAPLISLKIKGFLWYQGETNTYNPGLYADMLQQLAADWRADFGDSELAFYYVQIAPWRYGTPREGAELRDRQRRALDLIPHSGMAVTSDIGNIEDIHPGNKTDVGKRLAAWALKNDYGMTDIVCSGPLYRGMSIEGNKARVHFDYAKGGLQAHGERICCFEIAGTDRHFYPATAVIEGESIVVSSSEVQAPAAVRFAFGNISEPNLFNAEGLPASCFRTDDWPAVWRNADFKVLKILDNGDALLSISCSDPASRIRYTLDGSDPDTENGQWAVPDSPVQVSPGKVLTTRMFDTQMAPADRTDQFALQLHLASGKTVTTSPEPSAKHPGSAGAKSLSDGLLGTASPWDMAWQGYEGDDATWTIDLGKVQRIGRIRAGFLRATAQWIFPPLSLRVSVSDDGKVFTPAGEWSEPPVTRHLSTDVKRPSLEIGKKARYIRMEAKNIGLCPEWHQGKGQKAWMYVDEITVE
ncbi:MAG: discoidin domain-containing protein [Lewinellaceae bacterium]|nr:discoidin domain-containing protein [Lewinellaceae bacterium]